MIQPETLQLTVDGLTLGALRWRQGRASKPVLALHGWLDNANSFVPLARYLQDVDLVAIDWPGHGLSGHLEASAHYHFTDLVLWAFGAADQLGWQRFNVLGHSLGACVAPFLAVACQPRISTLVLLEASGPLTEPAKLLPPRLRQFYQDACRDARPPRQFSDIDEAVEIRLAATEMAPASARLIVERQLRNSGEGYHWRFDSRQRAASAVYLMEEQVLAVLGEVHCPVLAIVSSQGYIKNRPTTERRFRMLQGATVVEVDGWHHMHMDSPEPTAMAINPFWQRNPQSAVD